MKQLVLTSAAGTWALAFREKLKLIHSTFWNIEAVGTLANDQLATLLITHLCAPGKTFVDVGAHIGSVLSEVHGQDASVEIIAVEAIPEKASNLRRAFPYAQVHACAVSDAEGEVSFFINLAASGYSSLLRPNDSGASTKEITVPRKRLDRLVPSEDVDALKIDVEGAELNVLRGAEQLLTRCRPTVMFESAPPRGSGMGWSKRDLWNYLNDLDYVVLLPNRIAHEGHGLLCEGFLESHIYPRRTTNYLAVPQERRVEIRDRARRVLGIGQKEESAPS